MADETRFWQLWAPHLAYLEDNHLDLCTIRALVATLAAPVLVVGGGQGLLVNELQQQGLSVDGVDSSTEMVRLAAERRGVKLVLTDGSSLPFADGSYATAIIATGVVDFLDDEAAIQRIIAETSRVTHKTGKLLVSFYKVHPVTERFLRRIGIMTACGTIRRRKLFELSRLEPGAFITAIRKDSGLSLLGAIAELVKLHVLLPRQERQLSKNLAMILKSAANADELIASVSETNPYRNREHILALFKNLDIRVNALRDFGTCFVAELGIAP